MASVVVHGLVCSSVMERRRAIERADVVLQPSVADVGLLQFERHAELEGAGYRAPMDRAQELTTLLRD